MRSAAGWKPAGPCLARLWGGTTDLRQFCVPVAQQQSSRSITGRPEVRILPGIPIYRSYLELRQNQVNALLHGTRLVYDRVRLRFRPMPGKTIRTSAPGPGANGIVPPACGMGCKSSVFRHFQRGPIRPSALHRFFHPVVQSDRTPGFQPEDPGADPGGVAILCSGSPTAEGG